MSKDKRQEMLMLQRKKGKLVQALREGLEQFYKMGIKADFYVPKGKDNVAYLLVDEEGIANYFGRKVRVKLKQLDKNIESKGYYEDDVLVIYCRCNAEVDESKVSSSINSVKEELSKIGIKSEVIVSRDYFTKVYLMIDANSVVEYVDKVVRDRISKKNLKVEITTYRENKVLVVRFRK